MVCLHLLLLLQVRCWEVQDNGQTIPKAQQMHTGPVLDACWSDVCDVFKKKCTFFTKSLNKLVCDVQADECHV